MPRSVPIPRRFAFSPLDGKHFLVILSIIFLNTASLFAQTALRCSDVVEAVPLLSKIAAKDIPVERLKFSLETNNQDFTLTLYLGHENIGYIIGSPLGTYDGKLYTESHIRIYETRFLGKHLGTLLYYSGSWVAHHLGAQLVSSSHPSRDAWRLWEKHKAHGVAPQTVHIEQRPPIKPSIFALKKGPPRLERPILDFNRLRAREPELVEFLSGQIAHQ